MTLDDLAIKYNCDKSSLHHDYCKIYERYLSQYTESPIRLVEIGYGGYDDPNAGGESMRMWSEYMPDAQLVAIDIYPKNAIEGIWFINSDQTNKELPYNQFVINSDVIIDDGSHGNSDTIITFHNLWSSLAPGGLYFVEDVHASYDPFYSDSNQVPGRIGTSMSFFTRMCHAVNNDFIIGPYQIPFNVEFVHFYRDMVVIKKKQQNG